MNDFVKRKTTYFLRLSLNFTEKKNETSPFFCLNILLKQLQRMFPKHNIFFSKKSVTTPIKKGGTVKRIKKIYKKRSKKRKRK